MVLNFLGTARVIEDFENVVSHWRCDSELISGYYGEIESTCKNELPRNCLIMGVISEAMVDALKNGVDFEFSHGRIAQVGMFCCLVEIDLGNAYREDYLLLHGPNIKIKG